jgi:hypothetical protein
MHVPPAGRATRSARLTPASPALPTRARPDEKDDAKSDQHRGCDEPAAGLWNVQVGPVVAHAVGPAKHETEERNAEKHDAEGEH